ncbi:diguanylate cyclase [Permianibacter sp. IMCC34836]|uniref:sensor domain-containing diguanylate cyclase n=1 Tax=Permianibacter fluminis TaxID=2738515 RepID=UPI0015546A42|nr:diguanylate cyclase [Permianibacter fluminis]NQD36451.1 diguanylate cyclase [Permianibacter fluminis]
MLGYLLAALSLAGLGYWLWRLHQNRLQSEAALRSSEAKYRLLLDSAPCAIVITSLRDNTVLYLNRRAVAEFDVPHADEVVGTPAPMYYQNPADRELFVATLKRDGKLDDMELALQTPGGDPVWMSVSARVTDFEQQAAIFVAAVNVSGRKQVEMELREQRRVLQQFYDAMTDHVFLIRVDADQQFRLIATNNAMASFFGASKDQMLDRTLSELLTDPTLLASVSARYQHVVDTRQVAHYEESAPDRDTVRQDFDTVLSPLLDERGRCRYICGISRKISERKHMETALRVTNEHLQQQLSKIEELHGLLREQAIRDPLTGLFNRRYMEESLDRELSRALREGYPVSVVLADIDHFKKLNDTYGHPAGDEVLRQLAQLLKEQARASDIPCRYGGEEFLFVLPHANTATAVERAEQWRRAFEQLAVPFGTLSLRATLSAGVASYPGHGRTAAALIDAADRALYDAKHQGRNRICAAADKV